MMSLKGLIDSNSFRKEVLNVDMNNGSRNSVGLSNNDWAKLAYAE